jgi:hypothetical protein
MVNCSNYSLCDEGCIPGGIRGVVANRREPERPRTHLRGRPRSNIAFTKNGLPFNSSFLVLRLNCFHHEAKSRFDGGELAPTGSGEVGRGWTGSAPGCDLPTVTMASPEGDSRWNRRYWESDKRGEVGVSIEGIRES